MIATLLRKPIKKTVAQNALENGCGGLNIDATRVGYSDSESIDFNAKQRQEADPKEKGWSGHVAKVGTEIQMHKEKVALPQTLYLSMSQIVNSKAQRKLRGIEVTLTVLEVFGLKSTKKTINKIANSQMLKRLKTMKCG